MNARAAALALAAAGCGGTGSAPAPTPPAAMAPVPPRAPGATVTAEAAPPATGDATSAPATPAPAAPEVVLGDGWLVRHKEHTLWLVLHEGTWRAVAHAEGRVAATDTTLVRAVAVERSSTVPSCGPGATAAVYDADLALEDLGTGARTVVSRAPPLPAPHLPAMIATADATVGGWIGRHVFVNRATGRLGCDGGAKRGEQSFEIVDATTGKRAEEVERAFADLAAARRAEAVAELVAARVPPTPFPESSRVDAKRAKYVGLELALEHMVPLFHLVYAAPCAGCVRDGWVGAGVHSLRGADDTWPTVLTTSFPPKEALGVIGNVTVELGVSRIGPATAEIARRVFTLGPPPPSRRVTK